MTRSDLPPSATRDPIALRGAALGADLAQPRLEGGSGAPAAVPGIPIALAILLPAVHRHSESAWNQHIPFAFWLVQAHRPSVFVELGTFRGTSYFSFCQAVAALRLPTRCFAVDTWSGDSHTGFYDESVFAHVNACNELKYAGFSRLVRSSFDEALPHFLDGSIDLLHIDGLHTYEACRHDFESWLPKLSRRAIVLFHDTNVRERGFGVHRLWAELAGRYPHFEFVHEHGLGVLGVGAALDAPVRELFAAADDGALTSEIRSAFWRLASTVRAEIDLQASSEERTRLETRLNATIGEHEIEVSRLTAESARLGLALEEKEREAAELMAQCAAERSEKAELAMALAETRSERAQLDAALTVACSRNSAQDAALAKALSEKAELGTALDTVRSEKAELSAALAPARQESAERQAALDAKATELAAVGSRAERSEAACAAARKELDALRRSTSWRITQPLRQLDSVRSHFAGHTARAIRRVTWTGIFARRVHAYFVLRENIKLIEASGLLDHGWYVEQHPDVRAAGVNPVAHYLRHGADERRDPNPFFYTDWYLNRYPDVRAAGANPLVHYLRHGAAEGRDPSPLFDSDWYLDRYADVRAAGVNPLAHYLRHGAAEGRDLSPYYMRFGDTKRHRPNRPVGDIDAASNVNVRRLFAFISGCPGDSYRYRCEHMTELLCNIGYTADAFPPNVFPYNQLAAQYSIIVAHRVPWTSEFNNLTKQIRSAGGIIVYDVDDLVFDIQKVEQIDAYNRMSETEQAIYRDGVERYGRAMAICDAVTVSTEELRDEVHRLYPGTHVTVTRNKLSRTMCSLAADARTHATSQRPFITIAYFSGTRTHQKDFSVCDEALYRILREFTTMHLMIVGHLDLPERFSEFGPRVEIVPLVPWQHLPDLYARTDINLAPLEYHNDFAAGKSELKYLEAALLGVPTIASDFGAYKRSIVNWRNGVLCRDLDEWYYAMRELSRDDELRRTIGEEAKNSVGRCGTTLASKHITQMDWRQLVASSPRARQRSQFADYKPSVAFVVRAPIATTSGGYKKIFVLANYLKSRDYDVRVHVEQIAHLADKTEAEVRDYCMLHFGIDATAVFVGHLGIDPVDVAIATNWPTAPIVYDLDRVRAKLYFVQDFEPEFYTNEQPERVMADATYDLGLSVIAIGEYLKELLGSRGRLARSIPFGVEKCFHQAGQNRNLADSADNPSVLFFARPNIARRNFAVGVDALAALHSKYPETRIRLYGLESFAELPFPYEHLGQLPQAQLASEMAQSDIHLSYSLTNVSSVIYEAMACGCACIEARVPSVCSMVRDGENCILVEPTASATLEALDNLIKDQRFRRQIARGGYQYTRALTEECMCEEFTRHVLEYALVK